MRLARFVPLFGALEGYDGPRFRGDLVAGLTTGVMLIPQGMAYAMLAGLPPICGLYASLLPVVVYALFGTSRQLAVGPVAMVSLLVGTGVSSVGTGDGSTEVYVAAAVLLALLVGLMQAGMGIFRLGFIVNFLSHPVLAGFTSAAALIIGFSQLKHLLGVPLPRSHHVHVVLHSAAEHASEIHAITLALGVVSIAFLAGLKRWASRLPRALFAVAAASALVWGFDLQDRGVAIVGAVPEGLPPFAVPAVDPGLVRALSPIALTIALVGFMESIAVAKRYAAQRKYEVDANRELVGLGLANLAGAFTASYPVTGGFSRTAVNAQAGATSGVAGLVAAALVGLTLLFLTPLFFFLPKAVLAAVIMTAVLGLIDLHEVSHLWRVQRSDLGMWVVTFLSTLLLGIETGILVGVSASIAVVVLRTTRPHVAVLGRLPGTRHFRNVERFEEAVRTPGVLVVRVDSQFYFGNVNFLKETLARLEAEEARELDTVILDASGVNRVDASAEQALREILEDYRERGVRFAVADVKGPVRDVLDRSGFFARLGEENIFFDVDDAMGGLFLDGEAAGASRARSVPEQGAERGAEQGARLDAPRAGGAT